MQPNTKAGLATPDEPKQPKDTESVTATPVYFHDCPALGKHTKITKAYRGDRAGTVVYGWQYKCPFCSHTEGDFHPDYQVLGEVTDLAKKYSEASND